jgi:hypothetical protein
MRAFWIGLVLCGLTLGAAAQTPPVPPGMTPTPVTPAPATPPDYAVITLTQDVARTPDQTWSKIGPYCSIAEWLKVTCALTAGSGDVGTIRQLNGRTLEILVAKTPYSYTYTQPGTTILYHGTLAVEPVAGGKTSRIIYTLFYDAAPLATPEKKAADRDSRAKRFSAALLTMKAMAEAP